MMQRALVAVFLSKLDRAAPLLDALGQQALDAVVITNTDEFYQLVATRQVDAVIVDNELRGFLRGVELLERLFNDLVRPVSFLLAHENPTLTQRAEAIGVTRIVPVDVSGEELAEMVRNSVATTRETRVLIPPEARRLVQQIDCVRPLPQLLIRLCEYLRNPTATPADLARDISVDPKITADLLRVTNSSHWGRAHKATNLFQAVSFLGIHRTVSLVVSSATIHAQAPLVRKLPHALRSWYHCRNVLIGSTASAFASRLTDIAPETAYVLGLLQDVGILVLASAHGERYEHLLRRSREIAQVRLEVLERQDFRLTHAEVSAAVMQRWELPPSLTNLVLHHHDPEHQSTGSGIDQAYLQVMQIGEAFANLIDSAAPQRRHVLNGLLAHIGGGARSEACKAALADAVARTRESSQLFSVPAPSEETLQRVLEQFHKLEPLTVDASDGEDTAPFDFGAPSTAASSAEDATRSEEVDFASSLAAWCDAPPDSPVVLVIEDDHSVATAIACFLRHQAQVLHAFDATTACNLATQASLVVCDVYLRDIHGADVVRQLRLTGYRKPVLMISADRSRKTVEACIRAGINDFMVKPFSRDQLHARLAKLGLFDKNCSPYLEITAVT